MATVFIGIGSNLGNREETIQSALKKLDQNGITPVKCSRIIETDPVGGPPQGKFLNAVLECSTILFPDQLLNQLQYIENDLGRMRTIKNGPRTIDLDILLYDDLKLDTPTLTIPHPRMTERDFVMTPLKEIAPDMIEALTHASH